MLIGNVVAYTYENLGYLERKKVVKVRIQNFSATVTTAPISADNLSPFVQLVLKEMGGPFKRFVQGNGAALAKGDKAFVIDAYGEDVSYLCRPYVEQSRRMLIEKLRVHGARCSADESAEFAKILGAAGLGDVYGGPAASL